MIQNESKESRTSSLYSQDYLSLSQFCNLNNTLFMCTVSLPACKNHAIHRTMFVLALNDAENIPLFDAGFTFSLRQHETRQEQECEGYIHLVFLTLDMFSSCLEALGDMLVNQSRVKGNKNVLPHYWQFSHESVNVYICAYFVSFTSRQKSWRVPETRM